MANKLTTLICFVFFCGICHATPVISTISSTSISDNDSISLTGSGFGTNSRDIEWLGGSNGVIESGTIDAAFSRTNWTVAPTDSTSQAPAYSSTKAHSGSKSIMSSYPVESQYTSDYTYNHDGTVISEIYITYWTYFDRGSQPSGHQWKMWRLRDVSGVGDTDSEIMYSNWHKPDGTNHQSYVMLLCDWDDYSKCYEDSDTGDMYTGMLPLGSWYRMEITAHESDFDTNNGSLDMRYDDQSNTTHQLFSHSGIMTKITGTNGWRRFVFQNYLGNIFKGWLEIKYSNDGGSTFTGNSGEDLGTYIGLRYSLISQINSDTTYEYLYTWAARGSYEGPQGAGVEIGNGSDGNPIYFWVKYADDASGTNLNDNEGTYIGVAVGPSSTESTNPADYTWRTWASAKSTTPLSAVDPTNNYLGNGTTEKIYIDDIYIQCGSTAHIEIGDSSVYANVVHKEIQYPTAYNSTGITFTANQGSFENGSTAYVFVIDEDGSANATGEAITFASGGGASVPSPRIGTSGPAMKISSGSPVTRIGN